jgi:hypothetical protein
LVQQECDQNHDGNGNHCEFCRRAFDGIERDRQDHIDARAHELMEPDEDQAAPYNQTNEE